MGSPISLSGFNSIDFNLILNAIMDQERLPVVALETDLRNLEGQDTVYTQLASQLADVEGAAEKLSATGSFSGTTLTNSDTSILTASSSSSTPVGAYDVIVTDLARAQVTASTSTFADSDTTVVANGGTLTLGGIDVVIGGDVTLEGLADAINGTTDIPVTASILSSAPNTYQLVLTGNDTGLANAFTITNGLSGGAGVTFGGNAVDARDAAATVNNIPITSAENTITGAIPGTTLTLLKADPATTVTISVSRDVQALKTSVQDFMDKYNAATSFLDEQFAASAEGVGTAIGGDGLVRGLRSAMRQTLSQAYSVGGSFSFLAEVGIGSNSSGELTLDASLFDDAVEGSITDLESLFVGSGGTNGAFVAFETLIDAYTEAGGLLPDVQDRLDTQTQALNDRIFAMEERLAIRRTSLQAEFIAADLAIAQLNSQLDSLSALGNQFRLF